MHRFGITALGLSMLSAPVLSAGLERAAPSTRVLFEEGTYLEFSMAYVSPDLTGSGGVAPGPLALSGESNDLLDDYTQLGAAFKTDVNDKLSFALVLDQPIGADTNYGDATAGLPDVTAVYHGTEANLVSYQLSGQLMYEVAPGFSVHGGLRVQRIKADAKVPFVGNYSIETETSYGYGYMAGAAYQIPEIALRVALTYYSGIEHDIDATEDSALTGGVDTDSSFSIEIPQSVSLEFQTGIAADTLLFGSVRWVNWEEFDITPNFYPIAPGPAPGPLVNYTSDWTTYTLGVGRRLTDSLSASVSFTLEPASDSVMPSLGPVDGRKGIALGLKYKMDNMTLSGGLSYTKLGDANNALTTSFDGGNAWAAGMRIGFHL